MQYKNLRALINGSSSSRRYFMSLPVSVQMKLNSQGEYIHSAFELRKNAEFICRYYL